MIFTQLIQTNLRTKELGKKVEYYNRLDSTNEEAWELLDEGYQHGSIIITENQTRGKGRQSNSWSTVAGKGLAFTLILDKEYSNSFSRFISLATGISIVESIMKRGVECLLKWPNDIFASNKKIGGILCESKIKDKRIKKMIIGIGLNVNETVEEHPQGIQDYISTMYSITNHAHQRELIVAEFLNSFERWMGKIKDNSTKVIEAWNVHCMHINKSISFFDKGKQNKGTFIGLNEEGYAKIDINGKIETFNSMNIT